MGSQRRARFAALAILAFVTAAAGIACNALTGAHERFLDNGDAKQTGKQGDAEDLDGGSNTDTDAPLSTDGGDGGPLTLFIDVPPPFTTLNGATFTTNDAGTTITAYAASATHPVLVPTTQPAIPAEDYTVYATVLAPTNGEFGILTRVQPGGGAFVFGSKFGTENRQFLGSFAPPDWNPSLDQRVATAYTYVPNGRYKFVIKAVGNQISAKMWEANEAEPAFQLIALAPWATGRGVGYYNYLTNSAVLESLRISVP